MSIHAEVYVTNAAHGVKELVELAVDNFGNGLGLPDSRGILQDSETDMVSQVNEFLTALKERVDEMVDSAEEVSSFFNGQGFTSIYDIANV